MEKIRQQIIDVIQRSQHILVMPSAPADGDSLGSALALYLAFKKLDKDVTVVSAEPVPDAFQFLPTTNVINHEFTPGNDFIVTLDCEKNKVDSLKTKIEPNKVNIIITAKKGQFSAKEVSFSHGPSKYDLIITVDTGDVSQLGRFYEDNTELFTQIPVINIDHHASNGQFGKINFVDIMASATTEMLVPLLEELERKSGRKLMDEDIATLLLAGIITDTGSFQNANTTPRSFAAAAHLVKYGARQQEIIQHVFKTKRLSMLRLWGRILSNIKVDPKHHFVWATISRKDFAETGARDDETGGIIDELMTNAPGTEVVLILKHRSDGYIGGSLRTLNPSIDASAIAEMFGGGGHVQAAGFKIKSDDLQAVETMVVEKIRGYQQSRLKIAPEEVTKSEPMKIDAKSMLEKMFVPTIDPKKQVEKMTDTKKEKTVSEKETAKPNPKKQVEKSTKPPRTEPVEESFTDVIMRKAVSGESEVFNLDEGVTYKFED
jgi:phosphoesterase RecJ-like protein